MTEARKPREAPYQVDLCTECGSDDIRYECQKCFNDSVKVSPNYRELCEMMAEAMEESLGWMSSGILRQSQYVKQLDGTVEMELIDTYQGKLLQKLKPVLSRYKQAIEGIKEGEK